MMLDRFGPENEMRVARITAEYEEGLYHAIDKEAPEIELRNLSAWLQTTTAMPRRWTLPQRNSTAALAHCS